MLFDIKIKFHFDKSAIQKKVKFLLYLIKLQSLQSVFPIIFYCVGFRGN